MRKHLTVQQLKDYEQLCRDRENGSILTPDGLRFICAANGYDATAIGQYFLELLPQICPVPPEPDA